MSLDEYFRDQTNKRFDEVKAEMMGMRAEMKEEFKSLREDMKPLIALRWKFLGALGVIMTLGAVVLELLK